MAKQINYTDKDTGANYPTAYFRISRIIINRPMCNMVNVFYDGFVDETSARENKKPIYSFSSVLKNLTITNATDIRALIYEQDTNPIFANAINV